jgi:hypothetical protein
VLNVDDECEHSGGGAADGLGCSPEQRTRRARTQRNAALSRWAIRLGEAMLGVLLSYGLTRILRAVPAEPDEPSDSGVGGSGSGSGESSESDDDGNFADDHPAGHDDHTPRHAHHLHGENASPRNTFSTRTQIRL